MAHGLLSYTPVSSCGLSSCVCVLISSYKDINRSGVELTRMTSFYLSYLGIGPTSNYRFEVLGVKISTYEFKGNTIQPITPL